MILIDFFFVTLNNYIKIGFLFIFQTLEAIGKNVKAVRRFTKQAKTGT